MLTFATQAIADSFNLSNNFVVDFNQQSCSLAINQGQRLLWLSDNNFVRIGKGNVDDITIMTNGNVVNFPEVINYTGGPAINCSAI